MWMTIAKVVARKVLGELFRKLLENAASTIFKRLTDKESNEKAYEIAKHLFSKSDLTPSQKAEQFNLMMLAWAKDAGKELKDSTLNCLREFAVSVIKSEIESSK